jgi:LemA protein
VDAVAITGVAVLALLLLGALLLYNSLIRARNMVDEAWSGVDVQLRRRHDLVPNLVAAVKGYAAHEATLMTHIAADRAAALAATDATTASLPESALAGHVRALLALAESYPDLKASRNFADLQSELASVENNIAAARRIYNGNVRSYNDKIQSIPGILIAGPTGFAPRTMFIADESDRQPVTATLTL